MCLASLLQPMPPLVAQWKAILLVCPFAQRILTISCCLFLKTDHSPIQLAIFAAIFAFHHCLGWVFSQIYEHQQQA